MNQDLNIVKSYIIQNCILFEDALGNPFNKWLFDLRVLLVDPVIAAKAAEVVWQKMKQFEFDYLICKGVAGILWAKELQKTALNDGRILGLMIVRDQRKKNNRKRLVEGDRPKNSNASGFFVDDFINTGDTYRSCLDALQEENIQINVIGLCALVYNWYFTVRAYALTGKKIVYVLTRHELGLTRVDPKVKIIKDIKKPYMNIFIRNIPGGHEITSPPILRDTILYIASNDHYVRCIDLLTKEIIWEDQAPMPPKHLFMQKGIINVMPIMGDHIYYTSYHGYVTKLNRFTGQKVWRVLGDRFIHSSPILSKDGKVVYFSTEYYDEEKPYGDLVAMNADNGNLIWRFKTSELMPCTPCLHEQNLYVSSNNSFAYCVDAATGSLVWEYEMPGPSKGQPAVINDKVIFINENGYIHVFYKDTGELYAKKRCSGRFRHCIPKIINNTNFVVIDRGGFVKCYDCDLNMLWITQIRGNGSWYPEIFNNNLFFLTSSGYLSEIDPLTGNKLRYSVLDAECGSPVAINEKFIVLNSFKGVYVYEQS